MLGSALAPAIALCTTAEFFEPCDRPTALAGVPEMSLPYTRTLSALNTRMPAAPVPAIVLPTMIELETGSWWWW